MLLSAIVSVAGCSTLNGLKLWAPEWFGMEPIAPQLYADAEMSDTQRAALAEIVAPARQRVHEHFGGVRSTPDILACSTEACFQSSGGMTARAKAYGSSKILLSPRGLTVALLSHEWSHAEFYTRVGGYGRMLRVPEWFNEGLAVVVSNEPTHSEEVWQAVNATGIPVPALEELYSARDWLIASRRYHDEELNPEGLKVVYAVAGHEVRRWYRNAGPEGLDRLIQMLRQGEDFDETYKEIEGR